MRTAQSSKAASILLSFALVVTSFPMPAGAAPVSATVPDFVKTFTPSQSLGFVDSFYKGQTDKPVILIQDLHANYGVQKKIQGLLEFLQPKTAPAGRPMVLGMEGAWGEVNLASVRGEPEKKRRAVGDFLLKEAEISAMEYFAGLSKTAVRLVGIDNPEDYIVHSELFRSSLAARLALAKKTDVLRQAINDSKDDAPQSLRRIWKTEEAFHAGEMDLSTLSKKLGVTLTNYRQAEEALAREKASLVEKQKGDKAFFLNNIVEADQNLSILGRLLRQQLTFEEVQLASKRVPAMLVTVRALLPGENIELWNDTIRAAIDHYAVALLRNKPISEHALDLVQKNPDTSIVIVTGGFHTAGIVDFLKLHKVSYMVVAPVVESHTARDEELYVMRMMDIHVTDAEIASASEVKPQAQTVIAFGAWVARGISIPSQMFSGSFGVWPRSLRGWTGRGVAPVSPSSAEISRVAAVRSAMTTTPAQMSGLLGRIANTLRKLTGRPKEYAIETTPNVNNAAAFGTAAKPAAEAKPAGSLARKPAVVAGVTVAMTLGYVAVGHMASVATQYAGDAGGSSSTLVSAVAGLGAMAIAGAINWKGKGMKEAAMRRARMALEYGKDA